MTRASSGRFFLAPVAKEVIRGLGKGGSVAHVVSMRESSSRAVIGRSEAVAGAAGQCRMWMVSPAPTSLGCEVDLNRRDRLGDGQDKSPKDG